MDPVTAIRVQQPLASAAPPPTPDRTPTAAAAQTPPPVAAAMLSDALRQPARQPALPGLDLAPPDTDQHPARAAAEAAREAYIRASLAAGISPLPLSGA